MRPRDDIPTLFRPLPAARGGWLRRHRNPGGCVGTAITVARAPFAAVSVAKVPFKVGGKVVDWTTTSQAEADRNYGRKIRGQEAREGRERRDWARHCQHRAAAPECRSYAGYRAGS